MKKEGSTKFTGYESIAKQFRCNNQDAVALLRNAGHNIPEGRRRILLDHAEKAAQQFREAERWQCLPGSGAGPSLDAINLDEACSLDRPAEGTMSDEEEGNVKSAATNASLSQDMSDTDDEATVAFGTSDAEQDEDQKPPAKASSTPQENAMTREGGKPPADASLPQKNANDQGKQVAAPTIGRSSKSLPKSDKKANACNKKAVASKKKSAPMKPRIKTSVPHQDNQSPRLRSVRGSSSGGSNLVSPQLAPASSSTGDDDKKENDVPEQVHKKQENDGHNASSNQHNRPKNLLERLQAIEAGLGLSPISHIPRLHDRVQHLELEVS
jgi:hypothetical protein